ncbi:hypothetical protein [Micromonospora sp. C95]|uniref:hypothetical protein n=1 Tax=Micromonospora sp. C95 TaxID=2824882 RepID=UPI001B3620E5|nr:hypothetical protein [Micromonospora sp. C95]
MSGELPYGVTRGLVPASASAVGATSGAGRHSTYDLSRNRGVVAYLCRLPGTSISGRPLLVEGDADEGFLISNNSADPRTSRDSGLILEELGDGPPTSSFRLNDNGPAPDRE